MDRILSKRSLTLIGFNYLNTFINGIMVSNSYTIDQIYNIYSVDPSDLNELSKEYHSMLKYLKCVEGVVISNSEILRLEDENVIDREYMGDIYIHFLENFKTPRLGRFLDHYIMNEYRFLLNLNRVERFSCLNPILEYLQILDKVLGLSSG